MTYSLYCWRRARRLPSPFLLQSTTIFILGPEMIASAWRLDFFIGSEPKKRLEWNGIPLK
jgi:hypothetical protein